MLIPDVARCNCTMEGFTTANHNHDDDCRLWWEVNFCMGDEHWDAELQRMQSGPYLPKSVNPYENAEDYIWDGDTPVISKLSAADRAVQTPLCRHEEEALAAITDTNTVNSCGIIDLPDGSYADFDSRVTYRACQDEDGRPMWVSEDWDADPAEEEMVSHSPDDVPDCHCKPVAKWDCLKCDVTRNTLNSPWTWMTAKDRAEVIAWTNMDNTGSWAHYGNICTHCFDTVLMPKNDKVDIRASKVRKQTSDTMPDFGIYASEAWSPDCPAIMLPWQDYGLPTCSFTNAARAIKRAWDAAVEGDTVEVGCVGSHGRTGTILACFAVLSDPEMTGPEAVAWVRKHHCTKAVEVSEQEWFVRWFRAWSLGLPFSEQRPGTLKVLHTGPALSATGKVITIPSGIPGPVELVPTAENCGNVAPGMTANARRRAEKRANRKEKALRNKQKNRQQYRAIRGGS